MNVGSGAPMAVDDQVEAVLQLVRAQGGRVTAFRRELLRCLFEGPSHRTAEELANEILERSPDVHLSTVYRNLEELERLGVIAHSHLGHGPATYQLASGAHGHFVCEECGATYEAPDEIFADLADVASLRYGFGIDPHHFAVLGHCVKCQPS
jgi:Fe2+ or Zn2+ uptake regulation protein